MITLPLWAVVCLCLPSVGVAVAFVVATIIEARREDKNLKAELEAALNAVLFPEEEYTPVCPCGKKDCTWDPAYIKHRAPEFYQDLWGDKTPEEAVFEPDGCLRCEEVSEKEKIDADT